MRSDVGPVRPRPLLAQSRQHRPGARRPTYPNSTPHPARMDQRHSAQIGGLPHRLASASRAARTAAACGLGVAVARRIGRCTIPELSVLAVNRDSSARILAIGLSRPRTTTTAPPRPGLLSRQRAGPRTGLHGQRRDQLGTLPTFTAHRSAGSVPNFAPAASPRVRRRHSSWPPCRRLHPAPESPTAHVGRRAPASEVYGGVERGGPAASRALKRKLKAGNRVLLVSDPSQDYKDRYGRLIRYVMKNGRDINRTQVWGGFSKVSTSTTTTRSAASARIARPSATPSRTTGRSGGAAGDDRCPKVHEVLADRP